MGTATRSVDRGAAAQTRALTVATCIGSAWRDAVLDSQQRTALGTAITIIDLDPGTLLPLDGTDATRREDVRVLITGWGAPRLDAAHLDALPALELVAHAAGSVRDLVTDELWARGIRVSTAADANAVSVADFTVAQMHLALKNAWRLALDARGSGRPVPRAGVRGLDTARIGLVGLGRIGRLVAQRLRPLDVDLLVFDPFLDEAHANALGVRAVSLDAVFAQSDVVSLHAPLTEGTRHLVDAAHLRRLPRHATLINTARGGLIDHGLLAEVLRERDDLFALLDVTDPEPLPAHHALLSLPNVLLTPHIAGSLGTEQARLGAMAIEEIHRFRSELPLEHAVEPLTLARSA